jgi:alanine-glyoxylate transaminase/serine-glyoxylate transaminase/serine-pyruvate transaminase
LNHQAFAAGIEKLGLSFVVAEEFRLPQLNAVGFPDGVSDAAVRTALLEEFNLEIGAGLGALAGKVWRIGLMGYASNQTNVLNCLTALGAVLADQGMDCDAAAAVAAARAVYAGN